MHTRKLLVSPALATVAVLAATVPAAGAATQVNTYAVTGAITGAKGATAKAPKPVAIDFGFRTGEASGLRPSPVSRYALHLGGVRVADNTAFVGCAPDTLNNPYGNGGADCPAASKIGTGFVVNRIGTAENLANQSLYCYLTATGFNSTKKDHLLLYLQGSPSASADPQKQCVTEVRQPLDVTVTHARSGASLSFGLAANLLHPGGIGVLDDAVTQVAISLDKTTTKVRGKTIGLFQSTGCTAKTKVTVSFTQENDGRTVPASKTGVCR